MSQTTAQSLNEFIWHHSDDASLQRVAPLLLGVAQACGQIAVAVRSAALQQMTGAAGSDNIQGEAQQKLDVISHDIMVAATKDLARVLASEEVEHVIAGNPESDLALVFDPLDGSSNLDVNISVGSIFSILSAPDEVSDEQVCLQSGTRQLCAGYALYGPATMLVITTGVAVNGFTFDEETGLFVLTHPNLRIAQQAKEFAINASNQRHWEWPIQAYIADCLAGAVGVRGRDFNMRWVASMVAEVHRILLRGGVFLYPADSRAKTQNGKLRLLYEANPMAMLVEVAGGAASTGRMRLLDVQPTHTHQRVPVILGAKGEVATIEGYFKQDTTQNGIEGNTKTGIPNSNSEKAHQTLFETLFN
ncbi:class 1 fructose-bisphosphatase [Chitinibacter sp. SCUT-21]|uniref:class 1 fructose-bisphosphatase n=1 Tax=Chitinibacter sp. SCUT-21 TaxID=2970891 RepID=UPI0035A5E0BF